MKAQGGMFAAHRQKEMKAKPEQFDLAFIL